MTGARNTELGCRQEQRHWRLSRARRQLRQWQSAVAEAGRLREAAAAVTTAATEAVRLRVSLGGGGGGWKECEVTK